MRECKKCKVSKSTDNFFKRKNYKDGFDTSCKSCRREIYKKWYNSEKGQEKTKKYSKEYYSREDVRERQRRNRIEKTFNISYNDYEKMVIFQDNKCEICGNPETDSRHKFLSIDHNHRTKEVRGLLCNLCNKALGLFKDNLTVLKSAVKYIRKYDKNV